VLLAWQVIRFVLSMQNKEGASSSDRSRMRHYHQLPSFALDEGKQQNDIHDSSDIDKTYSLGF